MRLYELTEGYRRVQEMVENLADDELIDQGLELLDELTDGIEQKCLNIGRLVKNLQADADAIRSEEKRLAARRRALENQVDGLKEYAQRALELAQIDKCRDEVLTVALQKSPPSLKVLDQARIPAMYFTQPDPVLDRKGLLSDIKAGTEIDGAEIHSGRHLRIR